MGKLAKCFVCRKEHDYCPTCDKTHGWKYFACSHEHFQIYIAMLNYTAGTVSKEDTKEIFNNMGITADSDLSDIIPEVEQGIRAVIGEKKTAKAVDKSTDKTVEKPTEKKHKENK